MTPVGNETPMAVEELSSSDEEDSFIKCKRDRAVKRKIEDDDLDEVVESKKQIINDDTTSTEENRVPVFVDHSYCMPQQVYSPPPIPDWDAELETADEIKEYQEPPILVEEKIPDIISPKKLKQPLAVRDNNKIENIDHLSVLKQRDSQVKTKYFNKRDTNEESAVLFEFLTKGIDLEDIDYLRKSYDSLRSVHDWMNESHWVNHPDILLITLIFNFNIIYMQHLYFF